MPSYPLTLPSELKVSKYYLRREKVVGRTTSPYTKESQTIEHAGVRWLLDMEFAPVAAADGANAIGFYLDLQNELGSFNVDVSDYDEGESGDTTTAFELVDGATPGWTKHQGVYRFDKLICQEAL